MSLDLAFLSPEERQTYLDLGRRYDPAVALAQADATRRGSIGAMRELMGQGFPFEDHMTLCTIRDELAALLDGSGKEPVDPEAVAILAGIVITLAREAEKAAMEAAKIPFSKSQNIGDLMITHWLKVVAKPKEGCEPVLKEAGSLQELFVLVGEDAKKAQALRELRRAWELKQAPKGEATKERVRREGPTPEQIAWAKSLEACKKERSEHGRSALTAAALLAVGFVGLLQAAEWDREGHTQANSRLGALGFLLALVSFFGLIRALIRLVVVSRRLSAIARREPVEQRW